MLLEGSYQVVSWDLIEQYGVCVCVYIYVYKQKAALLPYFRVTDLSHANMTIS